MEYYYVIVNGSPLAYPVRGGPDFVGKFLAFSAALALRDARADFGAEAVRGADVREVVTFDAERGEK
jgi:hypothetical protein